MSRLAAPLYFPQPRSRLVQTAGVILHVFAFSVSLYILPINVLAIGVCGAFVLSSVMTVTDYRESVESIRSALLTPAGEWVLDLRTGGPTSARVQSVPFVSVHVILVRVIDANKRLWLLTFSIDNTPPDLLRRLRIRLRWPAERLV